MFQKIEALTGRKMEAYPAEQEAVVLLLERVGEAQRIATMQVGGLAAAAVSCLLSACQPLRGWAWRLFSAPVSVMPAGFLLERPLVDCIHACPGCHVPL